MRVTAIETIHVGAYPNITSRCMSALTSAGWARATQANSLRARSFDNGASTHVQRRGPVK